ncbi:MULTISPECIES: hypothetical protein [Bradyrhizobium]|nr:MULTISPECIES: hypothetical protein [Bradyrhizobium]
MNKFDPDTVVAMRAALDEVCSHIPAESISARRFVASRILECAGRGVTDFDDLRTAGRRAVLDRFASVDAARSMLR